jgi:hypothetical protein
MAEELVMRATDPNGDGNIVLEQVQQVDFEREALTDVLFNLCKECRNWFCTENDMTFGTFSIQNRTIDLSDILQEGQYYRIVGSAFNDGVYRYPTEGLQDEDFDGAVWAMRIPQSFIDLANEVNEFIASEGAMSPYTSESWGGYSYTKATDPNGSPVTWQTAFASKLNKWRKI